MNEEMNGSMNPKFRLILLGCQKVGKTALINQFINNRFVFEYYPTKNLTIYKKLFNFNPAVGERDEFCYVEFIDTMAYDLSKRLTDYCDFVKVNLLNEKDISRSSSSTKIPQSILKSIKHEYISEFKPGISGNTNVGLFSKVEIMAYLFVFDFNNESTLQEMLELYNSIASSEEGKVDNEKKKCVKCFICNQYTVMLNDISGTNKHNSWVDYLMDKDQKTKEIVNKIYAVMKKFSKETNKFEDIKSNIFFTSVKNNMGVNHCFEMIFAKIYQNEDLWRGVYYAGKEEKNGNGEKKNEQDNGGLFGCCKKKAKREEEEVQDINFKEESDDECDKGLKYPQNEKEKEKEPQKKEEGWCCIY